MSSPRRRAGTRRLYFGLTLVAVGQTLIVIHRSPASDFYFPFVWFGYVLTLDGGLRKMGRHSLFEQRGILAVMISLSAVLWWVFEALNLVVRNWYYIGGSEFTGVTYALFATLCFSTVLPAIWTTALVIDSLVPQSTWSTGTSGLSLRSAAGLLSALRPDITAAGGAGDGGRSAARLMRWSVTAGVACLVLPLLFPSIFFGLIWGALFFLVEPINHRLGRSTLLVAAANRRFRTACIFAGAGLTCGLLWEFWNNWATVGWMYTVPRIPRWHLFRMPLFGYAGYLPFGLEAYAVGVLFVPILLNLVPIARGHSHPEDAARSRLSAQQEAAS